MSSALWPELTQLQKPEEEPPKPPPKTPQPTPTPQAQAPPPAAPSGQDGASYRQALMQAQDAALAVSSTPYQTDGQQDGQQPQAQPQQQQAPPPAPSVTKSTQQLAQLASKSFPVSPTQQLAGPGDQPVGLASPSDEVVGLDPHIAGQTRTPEDIIDAHRHDQFANDDDAATAYDIANQARIKNSTFDGGKIVKDGANGLFSFGLGALQGLMPVDPETLKTGDIVKAVERAPIPKGIGDIANRLGDFWNTWSDALGRAKSDPIEEQKHTDELLKSKQIDQTEYDRRTKLISAAGELNQQTINQTTLQANLQAAKDHLSQLQDQQNTEHNVSDADIATAQKGVDGAQDDVDKQTALRLQQGSLMHQADPVWTTQRTEQAMREAGTGTFLMPGENAKNFIQTHFSQEHANELMNYFGIKGNAFGDRDDIKRFLKEDKDTFKSFETTRAGMLGEGQEQFLGGLAGLTGTKLTSVGELSKTGMAPSPEKIESIGTAAGFDIPLLAASFIDPEAIGLGALEQGIVRPVSNRLLGAAEWSTRKLTQLGKYTTKIEQKYRMPEIVFGHIPAMFHDLQAGGLPQLMTGLMQREGSELLLYGGLKLASWAGDTSANVLKAAIEDNLDQGGFWKSLAARTVRGNTDAAVRNMMFSALTSGSPQEMGQNFSTMQLLHMMTHGPADLIKSLPSTSNPLFVDPGKVPNQPLPNPDYHLVPEWDRISKDSADNRLSPSQYNLFTQAKDKMRDRHIYLMPEDALRKAATDIGATYIPEVHGFSIPGDVSPNGKTLSFVDPEHFDIAFHHEVYGHPVFWMMPEDVRKDFVDFIKQKNDPGDFTKTYLKNTPFKDLNYSDMPTQAEVDAGTRTPLKGFTKDVIDSEMAAEKIGAIFKGTTLDKLEKNPARIQRLRYFVGKGLEAMHLPSTTPEAKTFMGIEPSVTAAAYFHQWAASLPGGLKGLEPASFGTTPGAGGVSYMPGPHTPEIRQGAIDALKGLKIPAKEAAQFVDAAPGNSIEEVTRNALAARSGKTFRGGAGQFRPAEGEPPPTIKKPAEVPGAVAPEVELTDAQHQQIRELINQGKSPGEAQAIVSGRPPTAEPPPATQPAPVQPGPPPAPTGTARVGLRLKAVKPAAIAAAVGGPPPGGAPPGGPPPGGQRRAQPSAPPPAPGAPPPLLRFPYLPLLGPAVEKGEPQAPSAQEVESHKGPAEEGAPPPAGPPPAPAKPLAGPQDVVLEEPKPATVTTKPPPPQRHVELVEPKTTTKPNSVTATEFGAIDSAAAAKHPEKYPSGNKGFPDFGTVDLGNKNQDGVSLPPEDIVKQLGNVMTQDKDGTWHADPQFAADVRNHNIMVEVTNPANGKVVRVPLVDIGPQKKTGVGLDVLYKTARDLNFESGRGSMHYRIIGGHTARSAPDKVTTQSVVDVAKANVGRLNTTEDPGTNGGELACADAVTRIIRDQLHIDIPKTLSTAELYTNLSDPKSGFKEVDPHTPGAIIISPTQGDRHGHTGIVGENGKIYSNSSRTGNWEQNYSVDSWTKSFSDLGVHAFIPTDQVGRVQPGAEGVYAGRHTVEHGAGAPGGGSMPALSLADTGGVGGGGAAPALPGLGETPQQLAEARARVSEMAQAGTPAAVSGGGEAPEENIYSRGGYGGYGGMPVAMRTSVGAGGAEVEPEAMAGGPPAAPGLRFGRGMRAASFMPAPGGKGRKIGGITPEEEEGEEPTESTRGVGNPTGNKLFSLLAQRTQAGLRQAVKQHSQSLSKDDTRVKKQADNRFKGEHFQAGDPLHTAVLSNVPDKEKQVLSQAQNAIANRQPMHISYASAPKAGLEQPTTTRSRQIEYQMSSPQARMLKTTQAQIAGHSFIPTSIGVKLADKADEPHEGYIEGLSTNAAANNHHHLNTELAAMGRQSPYPQLGHKFHNDLEGYVSNLNAGWKGTGDEHAVGTEEYPNLVDPHHVPYRMKRHEADFINAVLNNQAAKAKGAQGLRDLAEKGGTLLTEQGETNPIRHAIDVRQAGTRQQLAQHPENIANPVIQQAANRLWSQDTLEPVIRSFKAGLVHAIHEHPGQMPEAIRPGEEFHEITRGLHRQTEMGRPDIPIAASFMPAAGYVSPNVEEGTSVTRALRQLYSRPHRNARDFYQRVEDGSRIGGQHGGRVTPTIGNWQGTSEGSALIHDPDDALPEMRLKNAIRGLYSGQLGTASFDFHKGGEDRLYDIDFPNHNHQEVDKLVDQHQFPANTIYEGPDGTLRAHIIDSGGENRQNAIKLARAAGSRSPEYHIGTAAFDGGDSRPEAADAYRRILGEGGIQTREGQGGGGYGGNAPGGEHPLQAHYEEAEDNYQRLARQHGWEHPGTEPSPFVREPEQPQIAASFMPSGKAAKPPKQIQKVVGQRPSDPTQGNLWDKIVTRLGDPIEGAIPLRPARDAKGNFKANKATGGPEYEKDDYDLTETPLLTRLKKNLGFDEKGQLNKAPKGTEDTTGQYGKDFDYLGAADKLRLSHLDKISAVNTYADKLSKAYEDIQDQPDVMAGKGWYSEVRDLLEKHFPEHKDLVAQLFAATSARQGVKQNFNQAMHILDQHLKGEYDRHIDLYKQAREMKDRGELRQHVIDNKMHGDADEPDTEHKALADFIQHHGILPVARHGAKFGMNSNQVLKVLAGTWAQDVGGPKTPNYAGNLSGKTLQATIDMWAARLMRRLGHEGLTNKPWLIEPGGETGVKDVDFGMSQLAFRRAAEKHGLSPDDLQAIMWFAEQKHWRANDWGGEVEAPDYRPMLKAFKGLHEYADISPKDKKAA